MSDTIIIMGLIVLAGMSMFFAPEKSDVVVSSVVTGAFGYLRGISKTEK